MKKKKYIRPFAEIDIFTINGYITTSQDDWDDEETDGPAAGGNNVGGLVDF